MDCVPARASTAKAWRSCGPNRLAADNLPNCCCPAAASVVAWTHMSVSSMKLGSWAKPKNGGNRQFRKPRFSPAQRRLLLPGIKPGRQGGLLRLDIQVQLQCHHHATA